MKYTMRKQIHASHTTYDGRDVNLMMEIDCPVTPFIGLTVSNGDYYETVKTIVLNTNTGELDLFVEAEKEIYYAAGRVNNSWTYDDPKRLAELTAQYVKQGWEIDPR